MPAKAESYDIYFERPSGFVIMKWDGYATSKQFREGTEFMLKTLVENKATKVLADIREMLLIGMDDQQWLNDDFLPRAVKEGFNAIAIIRPKAYFNNVAVESVSFKADQRKLKINFFDNINDAKAWLYSLELI